MKPHEIIEIITKTTCRAYMLTLHQITNREERITLNNAQNKNIRQARIIIACMVAKYLGDEYVYDVLRVSREIMGAYRTAHNQYMFAGRNNRVFEVTNSIILLMTATEYNASPKIEVSRKSNRNIINNKIMVNID